MARKAKEPRNPLYARITAICKRSNNLSADIHKLAVDCLQHALDFADPRPLDALVKGLHAANRPVALMEWAKKFSPVMWNGDGDVGITKATAKTFKPFDIPGATAEPYWTPAEVVKKPLTLEQLKAIVAQMEKRLDTAIKEDRIAEGENIVDMRAFVAKVAAAAVAAEPVEVIAA